MMKALRCFALVLAILLLTVGCATGNATDIDTNAQYMGSEDCGESQIETDTSATETQAPDVSYTIIYPEGCERFIKDLAAAVRDDINKNTEKRLIYKSDKTEATPFEIIIGNTSREESEFGLENAGNDGWWVSVLNDSG